MSSEKPRYKVGEAPWDKKATPPTYKVGEAPWDKKSHKKEEPKTRDVTVDDFIPNLETPEALLTGFNDGAYMGYGANATAALSSPTNYTETRDAVQKRYNELENTNTLGRAFGKTVGGFIPAVAAPFSKAVQGMTQGMKYLPQMMGLAADGAVTGLAMNPGNTPGQVDGMQLSERLSNANTGALMGPVFGTGVKAISKVPEIPGMMRNQAKKWAYKSSGPQLSNTIVDQAAGRDLEIGQYMLENPGLVEYGGSTADVAKKSEQMRANTGGSIGQLFEKFDDLWTQAKNKPGFDPIRDKALLMSQASDELKMTEGKSQALNRLSSYIDERALENGDGPNQAAKAQFGKEVQDYIPKFKNFLKNKKEYQSSVGQAGENLDQPIMSGMADDLQRTENKNVSLETLGKDPSKAVAEPYETYTQGNLFEPNLPTRPENNAFNPGREVVDLLGLSKKITVDKNFQTAMQDVPYAPKFSADNNVSPAKPLQSEILGLQNTPRSYTNVEVPTVATRNGQTKMVLETPVAPTRPVRPDEVRNPMAPSKMREMKTSMDERVKYSRNPQNPDPAVDRAFYGGRKFISKNIDNTVEQLSPEDLPVLQGLNKKYGLESSIDDYSNKREARDAANKGLSLTDWVVGPHSIPALIAKKTGEKYGYQTGARLFDDVGSGTQNLSNKLNLDLNLGAFKDAPPELMNNLTLRYLMMNTNEKGK